MGKVRSRSHRRVHSNASGDDVWQSPSLTASERAYMIRKAKEASVVLVDHAHTLDGPVQWHYTGKLHGIQMYRGEGSYDRGSTSGTEFLCGVTTMMGSIEEVANYFDQQTTEEMVAKKAEDVLECGVLYSLVRGDPKNPFYRVSAKYQLYEGPSAFSRERDYCFLECQNTFRHASGRRGWVLSMHSIKLPTCPELDGVVRGSMYQSGYVFVEAEKEGYMDVMHSLQINFKTTSRLPQFMLNSALKRRILSVVTISREIQTNRMGRQTLLKKKQLMPKRARALCVNCARKFSLFVRKTRCRVCGEVVCQPCAPQVMISTKRGPVKTRVCIRCYQLSPGDEYEPVRAQPNSHNRGDSRRMQNVTRYSDILQDQYDHPDMYHEEDEDSLEEDGDEDGLEEQSDYSVFAQSRFTDASRDSVATNQFGASNLETHYEGSSHLGTTSELDDSQYYDGESSFASGTSSSHWKEGNSADSNVMGWNQASSMKPAGDIYAPQASVSSNFYGASKYGSDYGDSTYTLDEKKSGKRAGRHKAAAPIPEDESSSHCGYNVSPNASHNPKTNCNPIQGTTYTSDQVSNVKVMQGGKYDSSLAIQNSDMSHTSKTVSIQSLAKARSARYGIKSQFPLPVPPPPPPLSAPRDEYEESEENESFLHIGALKSDKRQSSKDRKPKGIATRKMFTPPPPKEGRHETDRTSAKRDSKVARDMAFNAALANRDSRMSQTSSRDSSGFGSTRASAILEQVRRSRGQTLRVTSESDRASAVLKSKEEEHLMRMREIEHRQKLAKDKGARRLVASNESRSSVEATQNGINSQNDGSSTAAARKKKEQPRRSSHRSAARSPHDSFIGPAPGSPPGTPPSMRGRRLPNNTSFNSRSNRSYGSSHSRRTDASSDFGDGRFLSNRSNAAFERSGARVSVVPYAQSEDAMVESQRPGYRVNNNGNYFNGRRLNGSQEASKGSMSSFSGQQLDSSYVSSIPELRHQDDLAFDASQLLVDKTKFSSSFAILETPDESLDHVVMMERSSAERSSIDSLLSEDLLSQSSAGMAVHINSIRARASYKLPDEDDRSLHELRMRQEEHRKRMEELTKMAANHVVESIRDSTSTLGDLHDSSISLTGYSRNYFGDSTISPTSSASSVVIDDGEYDFESRPLGRTKRSGTIAFALEELEQVPGVQDNDELSEGPDDSDTSICPSEEHAENYKSEQEFGSCLSEEESSHKNTEVFLPAYRFSRGSVENKHENEHEHENESVFASRSPSEECVNSEDDHMIGFSTPPRRLSVGTVESEHERSSGFATPTYRPSMESVESKNEHTSGLVTPPRRPSVEPLGSEYELTSGLTTPPRRPSVESGKSNHGQPSGMATSPRRPSMKAVESEREHLSGLTTPPRRPSMKSVESEYEHQSGLATPPCRPSMKSVESEREHSSGLTTPPRHPSIKSVESEHEHQRRLATPPRHLSVESVESEREHMSGLPTPPRRPSMESMKSEPEHPSGLATPPRRLSVKSAESDHEHTIGLAALPGRPSMESMESEREHMSGLTTSPRRFRMESEGSEYERTSGLATPPCRPSMESVGSEYERTSGLATPPRRPSVESAESDHEHTIGLAALPGRPSIESMESKREHMSGLTTSPRRLSMESEESGYERTSGLATPPCRLSVESAEHTIGLAALPACPSMESMESEREHMSGLTTSPRRLSMESEESEYERTSGLATPPCRPSVESMESEYKLTRGLATLPSMESVECQHEHTRGLATPPRRSSVKCVEPGVSEHEQTSGLAPRLRSLSAEVESGREQQTGFSTPSFRGSTESERLQMNGLVPIPRHQSVKSARSEREHESESARLSHYSCEDSVERECDSNVEDAAYRCVEKLVENERDDSEQVESTCRFSNGTEPEDAVALPSNEPVARGKSNLKFQPHSSQLIPGEGGLAVDEFCADSLRLVSDSKLLQVDENSDEDTRSPCDTPELHQKHLNLTRSTSDDECDPATALMTDSMSGIEMSEHRFSPRESCASAIDEELMNRPTNELFDMIRANRPMCNSDGSRSLDMMYDLEASHLRRMEELNRIAIDRLGNRISNLDDDMLGSAFQPGRSLHPGFQNEEKAMLWRSSDVMEEVHSKHQVDMERLRRRIRQLEEECRESIASVLTAEEMDLSEFDDNDDSEVTKNGFNGRQSFNPQTSFMDRSDLSSSTISEHGGMYMPLEEPLPARILFEQIAQLTRLQQEMAEAEGDDDEEEYHERIKEQYRVLRSIKANSSQEHELLSHQECESVSEDEENWI